MNHASLDNADAEKRPGEIADSGEPTTTGGSAVPNMDHSTLEIARLKAECDRLTALVREVEKQRDAYLQSLYHYVITEINPEDEEEWANMGPGVTFDEILQDMDRIDRAYEASKKP